MKRLILSIYALTVYGQVQTLPNNAGSSKAVIDSNFSWLHTNKAALSHVHLITEVTGLQTALNAKADAGHNHDAVYVAIGGTYVNPSWIFSIDWSKLTSVPSTFAPSGHAASHENGGSDEVAVALAAVNAIPKADATGKLAAGWIPDLSSSYQVKSEKGVASGYASLNASTKVPIAQLPTGSTSSTVALGNDARFSDARSPTAHASTHQNGGSDEIATAVAAANGIPKAGLGGTLASGWLPLPGATSIGGVQAKDCSAGGQFVQKINTDGTETCATPAGGGNISGPGSSTSGYLPTWNGITGTSLAAGLPVSATAGANTVAESGAGGKLDIGWIPTGTTALTVAVGNDARLSDARTPTVHASTHLSSGSDAMAAATPTVRGTVTTTTANSQAVSTDDARMTNARTPTAHAATHQNGGGDEIATATAAANAIPKADATGKVAAGWIPDLSGSYQAKSEKGVASGYASLDASTKVPIAQLPTGSTSSTVALGNDARFSDARSPTAHASTHRNGGSDEIATAVAAANGIPKAGLGGTLAAGWLPLPGATSIGGVQAKDCSAGGQFVQKINTDGTETCATPADGGNVNGPGSSTNGYLPQWNGIGGTLLSAGLPVSAAAAANTVAESGAGGKLDIGWIPTGQTGTTVALGNDTRFTDARAPTAHASTHLSNGSDAIAAATPTVRGTVTTTTANSQAVSTDDARMTNARTPTAHAATHQNGGGDEIATATAAANAIPKAGVGGTLAAGWIPDLSAIYQAVSGKNAANGYAGLDGSSRIAKAQDAANAMYTDQANTLGAYAWDASGASTTKPAKAAASDPATCAVGEQFYNTTSNTLKVCTATNTWTSYAPGGSGIVNQTTGAGAPAGSCTAPSGSNLTVYTDTTNQDEWFCSATNTWKKLLSTTNSGTYIEEGAEGTAPAAPAAGSVKCYFDSTAHTQICLDSSGNAFIGIKGLASRVANQFTTHTDALGIQHQAAIALADLPSGATQTIASGQTAMPTAAVSANSCSASATTATATGAATTDAITVTYASDPTAVTGYGGGTAGGITVRYWPTLNTVNFKLCNETGASITPGALSINWRVTR